MSWQQRALTLDHGFSGAALFMLWEAGLCTIGGRVAAGLHCRMSVRKFPFSPSQNCPPSKKPNASWEASSD